MAWSADGKLASGSTDNTVIIWDLKTGQPAQTLKGHGDSVSSVAWSLDGRLASGSADNTVIIWDLKMGQPAQTLKGHIDTIYSVAWSADGRLASGSYDNTVIIWDIKTGQPAQTLTGHTESVTSVAWSADGRLASGSLDNTVIIWDFKNRPTCSNADRIFRIYNWHFQHGLVCERQAGLGISGQHSVYLGSQNELARSGADGTYKCCLQCGMVCG